MGAMRPTSTFCASVSLLGLASATSSSSEEDISSFHEDVFGRLLIGFIIDSTSTPHTHPSFFVVGGWILWGSKGGKPMLRGCAEGETRRCRA